MLQELAWAKGFGACRNPVWKDRESTSIRDIGMYRQPWCIINLLSVWTKARPVRTFLLRMQQTGLNPCGAVSCATCLPFSFAFYGLDERYGDLSTAVNGRRWCCPGLNRCAGCSWTCLAVYWEISRSRYFTNSTRTAIATSPTGIQNKRAIGATS